MNQVLDSQVNTQEVVREDRRAATSPTSRHVKAIGNGAGRRCEHDQLVPAFIAMMEAIERLVDDTSEPHQRRRSRGGCRSGPTRAVTRATSATIVEGVNRTLDAVTNPVERGGGGAGEGRAAGPAGRGAGRLRGRPRGDQDVASTRWSSDLRESIGADRRTTRRRSARRPRQLTAISQQMAANAEETATQTGVVSAASEQVSKNLTVVATSSEEMLASIREIAKSANEAAKMAKNAVDGRRHDQPDRAEAGRELGGDRQRHQGDHVDRRADEPAGAQRHDRGGARRRGGQGVRGRRQRGQGAGQGDGQGDRGHQPEDRGDPGRDRRARSRPSAQISRIITADRRRLEHDRVGGRGADGDDERDRPQHRRGRAGRREIARNVSSVADAAQSTSQGATDTQKAARA